MHTTIAFRGLTAALVATVFLAVGHAQQAGQAGTAQQGSQQGAQQGPNKEEKAADAATSPPATPRSSRQQAPP